MGSPPNSRSTARIRVGVLMGGPSREREVSFAGGRTVCDNLERSLFVPVPIFVDPLNVPILLRRELLYRGSIRDFFPDPELMGQFSERTFPPPPPEMLDPDLLEQARHRIGIPVSWERLPEMVDVVFPVLHGPWGEDGVVQGLLTHLKIPYVGSGILPSALCVSKWEVRVALQQAGFSLPPALRISRESLLQEGMEVLLTRIRDFFDAEVARDSLSLDPDTVVVRPVHQGSSLGVGMASLGDNQMLRRVLLQGFFGVEISLAKWRTLSESARLQQLWKWADFRSGPGFPVEVYRVRDESAGVVEEGAVQVCPDPQTLYRYLEKLSPEGSVWILGSPGETAVLVEPRIRGTEFSCIVLEDVRGTPIPLIPTEIQKFQTVFTYRAKYLPGFARKHTPPISLSPAEVQRIRQVVQEAYRVFRTQVYARIDGFYTAEGVVYLTDPNTTSGMLPSSLLFHQVALLGWSPSEFLSWLIQRSLEQRGGDPLLYAPVSRVRRHLGWLRDQSRSVVRQHVAVILGGISSERHISVESGRNAWEKLSASARFHPIPHFMDVGEQPWDIRLYRLPHGLIYRDNADDIREMLHKGGDVFPRFRAQIQEIQQAEFTGTPSSSSSDKSTHSFLSEPVSPEQLRKEVDVCLLALHGKPGEDGTLQQLLEKAGIPYTGSGPQTARLCMDKYICGRFLRLHGFRTPHQVLISRERWEFHRREIRRILEQDLGFPEKNIIAKPSDEGCSNAVVRISRWEDLEAFARGIFYEGTSPLFRDVRLRPRPFFLVEEFLEPSSEEEVLKEITVGVLTYTDPQKGGVRYRALVPSGVIRAGEILTLEEKFLVGEGQNITPFVAIEGDKVLNHQICTRIREEVQRCARVLGIHGYARIDAFVRFRRADPLNTLEIIFLEVNTLPGITPATVLFHQLAYEGILPVDFFEHIVEEAVRIHRAGRKPVPLLPGMAFRESLRDHDRGPVRPAGNVSCC